MTGNITESPQIDKIPPTRVDQLNGMMDAVNATKKDGYKGDPVHSVWRVNPLDVTDPEYFDDPSLVGPFDSNSIYAVVHNEGDSKRLSELDGKLHGATPLRLAEQEHVLREFGKLVGVNASGQKFEAVYRDGNWTEDFMSELDARLQAEDDDWFEAQREGFRRMEEGEPQEPRNEPWRAELQAKAMEVARGDGRGHPEEADFNTAQILMGDKIPQEERDRLQRDLIAIEEGRSSGNY